MWWNFIGRLLLGFYELLLALLVIYQADLHRISWLNFHFECQEGLGGYTKIEPKDTGWAFVTLQNVLVVLSAKFSYTVFYTIPFKMNRIKKTKSELESEQKSKQKKKDKTRESLKKTKIYKINQKKKQQHTAVRETNEFNFGIDRYRGLQSNNLMVKSQDIIYEQNESYESSMRVQSIEKGVESLSDYEVSFDYNQQTKKSNTIMGQEEATTSAAYQDE